MPSMSSGGHSNNIGAIVGGTLGAVAGVTLIVTALLLWRRRNQENPHCITGEMFTVAPSESKPSIDSMRPGNNTIPTPLTYTTDTYLLDSYLASLRAGQTPTTASTDPDQTTPLSGKQQAARQQRQKELELHIRYLQDELRTLGPGPGPPSAFLSAERAEDARQMQVMREQIALLQAQQHSSWAQGLTDEPPPGYTADAVVQRATPPQR